MNFNFWKLLSEKLRVFKHNLIYFFFMYKTIRIGINKIRITLRKFKNKYEIILFSINF